MNEVRSLPTLVRRIASKLVEGLVPCVFSCAQRGKLSGMIYRILYIVYGTMVPSDELRLPESFSCTGEWYRGLVLRSFSMLIFACVDMRLVLTCVITLV